MVRKPAHTALEAKTKGFVITRMATTQITSIVFFTKGNDGLHQQSWCKTFGSFQWF